MSATNDGFARVLSNIQSQWHHMDAVEAAIETIFSHVDELALNGQNLDQWNHFFVSQSINQSASIN